MAVFGLDAGQAAQTCAADQVEQECLNRIISMMGYAYGFRAAFFPDAFKIGIVLINIRLVVASYLLRRHGLKQIPWCHSYIQKVQHHVADIDL